MASQTSLWLCLLHPVRHCDVRASTEHQNYSTDHQESAQREYAAQHDFEVVAVYQDEGRSGLTLDGRNGLLRLLDEVQSGQADFVAVLVYNVSRWGRFQDVDESAYYEYACRKAGITVSYCAEPFTNDGSPLATLIKGLKRASRNFSFLHGASDPTGRRLQWLR